MRGHRLTTGGSRGIIPRAFHAAALLILLGAVACNYAPAQTNPTSDPSLDETRIALAVQGTSLANVVTQLTEQAPTATAPNLAGGTSAELLPAPASPLPPTPAPTQPAATEAPPTPAPSPTSAAPEGSVMRAPYDPAVAYGSPGEQENFEDTEGLFRTFSGVSNAWYADGLFHITFATRGLYVWSWSAVGAGNFYADIVIYNADECIDRDSAGMIFRGTRFWNGMYVDMGYLFGINCAGEYNMQATGPTGQLLLGNQGVVWPIINGTYGDEGQGWKRNDKINKGPGAVNRIGVKATGGEFSFYVNGNYVDRFNNASLPAGDRWSNGDIGLYLHSGQRDKSAVAFDDFSLWYR
jgi:hypothetical protein